MVTKMRIKLYSPDEKLLSDRLVEQVTEFNLGPKEKHEGPVSVELNLRDKEDVAKALTYLGKLALDLPITKDEKPKRGSTADKKLDKMLSSDEPVIDLKNQIIAKATSQEKLIALLREYNFAFLNYQAVADLNEASPGLITLKDKHSDYQFMARLIKQAKDPANDKWDLRLVFGIKIIGDRTESVKVYFWGKFEKHIKLPWESTKAINFKEKKTMLSFPEFLTYDDRRKWRAEHRKLAANPEAVPTKFYERWKSYIKVGQ